VPVIEQPQRIDWKPNLDLIFDLGPSQMPFLAGLSTDKVNWFSFFFFALWLLVLSLGVPFALPLLPPCRTGWKSRRATPISFFPHPLFVFFFFLDVA